MRTTATLPREFRVESSRARVTTAPGSQWQRVIKRTIDIFGATALLALTSPGLAIAGLLIWLDDGRPVFFVQKRVGQNRRRRNKRPPFERRRRAAAGPEFRFIKLRTMQRSAQVYAVSPRRDDDGRVTRLGRLLRRTCLDELPQLVNVLRGDMSLVGPRPEMPFVVAEYDNIARRRLEVKPGLTGLWQILGPRDRPIHHAIDWDLYYIENWSLWLDAKILLCTIPFAFGARNR